MIKKIFAPLLIAQLLSGCALFNKVGDNRLTRPTKTIELSSSTLQFNYTNPLATNYFRDEFKRVSIGESQAQKQKLVRNQILDELMALIDQEFYKFEFTLENTKNGKDLATSLTVLGLTAAATVVGGSEAKTILSAVAGGITGANLAVDKTLFKEMTMQAIRNEMRTLRAKKSEEIRSKRRYTVEYYSLDIALGDVVDYYYCGYVYRALDQLVLQSGISAKEASTNTVLPDVQSKLGAPSPQ